ncbi:MAG TPA: NAD+ synthase [Methanospirillum sp.]|uniref:NAD+ synthase n=1 Tax=Methanospirillum sp. TaxID=45200 RepID=UPI002C0D83C6|nr:NAD+ synthase [Methanospirillum sp.]HWQ64263.1 NAD+ synthase [Methanospirillum sp.]
MPDSSDIADQISDLLRATLKKSQASGYVVGLSGGVDSALVAALCTRAVGSSQVLGIFMPSNVTPPGDAADVEALGKTLSIKVETISIGQIVDQYRRIPGFVESNYLIGNLMARTRMTVLYYVANRDSFLVCGTSNRTEFLLGYCTKHGDNAADVQPIVHLLKTDVWDLARFLGVPDSIISRAPSAGLWHGQTDEGEIGICYAEIDAAIKGLDQNGWRPVSETEKKVAARCASASHKQNPAPSLLNQV